MNTIASLKGSLTRWENKNLDHTKIQRKPPLFNIWLHLPVLASFSYKIYREHSSLISKSIQVPHVNTGSQNMNSVETLGTGSKACFAGLYNQALPTSSLPVQYSLQIYPRIHPPQGIHVPWTTALLPLPNGLSVMPSQQKNETKFHIVPYFPSPDLLVIDPFSPRDSYYLLACLILCPKGLS